MRPSGPVVVAAWGALNGALVILLAALGGDVFVLALYGAVVGLIEIIALVVLLSRRRSRRRDAGGRPWRMPVHGDSVLIAGAGVAAAAICAIFVRWLALVAVPVFIAAALREITARQERSS